MVQSGKTWQIAVKILFYYTATTLQYLRTLTQPQSVNKNVIQYNTNSTDQKTKSTDRSTTLLRTKSVWFT